MTAREKLLDQLQKLRAMAEGAAAVGNQAEAEAFAAKVQALLTEHKLTMTDVDLAEQVTDDPFGTEEYDPIADGLTPERAPRQRPRLWLAVLAGAVADAHYCEVWVRRAERFIFIGRRSDVALATWMFTVLGRAAFTLADHEYRLARRAGLPTRNFYRSFHTAFAHTIETRYRVERERLERGLRATGTSLVRLETARAETAAFAATLGPTHTIELRASVGNTHAAARGQAHGEAANLDARGVAGGKEAPRRVGSAPRALPNPSGVSS